MRKYRISGIQLESGKDNEKNIKKTVSLFKKAAEKKPDFIVLPEMFEIAAKPDEAFIHAHTIPSPLTKMLSGLAKDHEVNLIAGSFFEKDGDKVYNTCLVFDRKGEIKGKYRKMHLFDAFGYAESSGIAFGEEPLICELDGLRFGVAICYDIRFPEIFRYYAVRGVKVVFLPACFFQPNHDHWGLNIRSRALDNSIFLAASNQTGKWWVGRSMVVNPWGVSVCSMGIEEGFYTCDIDLSIIDETRKKLPFLEGLRFDVVQRGRGLTV
ncbi:MAG TPA: nitrilase-related carbon-nitrogen hydrolase [Spirochaetota bacterium]|nr:nitrilase-related carbon-nitrogen hydrolase [Spirochaetota bacterium]